MMVKTTACTWPGLDQSSVLKERAARNKKAVQSMRSISAVKKLSTLRSIADRLRKMGGAE